MTMKKRNEKTSPRVARIAAKVLAMDVDQYHWWLGRARTRTEIRALAASCLTQAADKAKRRRP